MTLQRLALPLVIVAAVGVSVCLVLLVLRWRRRSRIGQIAFYQAKAVANELMGTYYVPGRKLDERSLRLLTDLPAVQIAEGLFKRALEAQQRGTTDSTGRQLVVTDENRKNVAACQIELALLYRIINKFGEAEELLETARVTVDNLLMNHPDHQDYLDLESVILYRLGELNHAQSRFDKARKYYEESREIDSRRGNTGGVKTTEERLAEIAQSAGG